MADDAPPELTEAQQAKLAAKQFKQDSRKLAKALKGKKPDPKLEAIERLREDDAFLARGDCLVRESRCDPTKLDEKKKSSLL